MAISDSDVLLAKILIVDDRSANVQLLEELLSSDGYQCVASTTDPHAVCSLHAANHYDLILLDIEMPGMDGFQVMEALAKKESEGYVPILVITAHPDHMRRALASGAKDFIAKPFDLVEVRTRIRNMLEVRLLYRKLENSNRDLEVLALHDSLTGLPNRRLLLDRLSLAIAHARRSKNMMAVLYLDLDLFKEINDTLGHDAGDFLLTQVGIRLQAAVREDDTVARLGGDEFVIVLSELKTSDDINMLANKVIEAVARPYDFNGTGVSMTASAGISIYPVHGESIEVLMKCADAALYQAKLGGKNNFRITTNANPVRRDAQLI